MLTLDLPTAPTGSTFRAACASRSSPLPPPSWPRRLGALREADPDLDPDLARGLAFALLCKGLARHSIVAWEGIGDAKGKPLPLTPEAAERLMDLDDMASSFWDAISRPLAAVAAEGNG